MRRTTGEKVELIRLVEGSDLSVRRTLRELRLNRSTFYAWYRRYTQRGRAGLEPQPGASRRVWNRIPPRVRQRVVDAALADPEQSPRELAWHFTDREGHFLSESSVYRIFKAYDLIPSPAYVVLSAAKTFQHPTQRPHELRQTDFTYLQVVSWGWYYLSTVLDDYSRYIVAWTLRTSMQAADVTETLDLARAATGVDQVRVEHRPRLLSDNGPCYVSAELATYLETHQLTHTRGAPYHPMTQGKIERYHPVDEEHREAREVLQPLGTRAGRRALRRVLQPSAPARGARQRDPGRRLRRATTGDPRTTGTGQTEDTGATQT